jgi:signal transduction histidine kinase
MNQIQVAAILVSAVYILLAFTVWAILHRAWPVRPLLLWTAGSLALGLGAMLTVAENLLAPWASHELANLLVTVATPLRIAALRIDLDWPIRTRRLVLLSLLDLSCYAFSRLAMDEWGRLLLAYGSFGLWTAAFAWHTMRAGQKLQSRSGKVMAAVEWLLAATLGLRVLAMAAGWTQAHNVSGDWDFVILVAAGLAAALYGNLGYLGLVLDRTKAAELQAREAELTEKLGRQAAAATANDLRALLQQRERLLQIMAHEVRQPLHNAGGALQSAAQLLGEPSPPASDLARAQAALDDLKHEASDRVTRAQAVLGRVHSVLDNTLAATKLLVRDTPLVLVDTDLELLVQLALGDLPGAQRPQVVMRWHTSIRSAELEPVLVRLALRNLMLNAFAHGGPDVQVWLDVAEQAEPPALLLQVSDDGSGLADTVLQHLASTPDGPALPVAEGDSPRRQGLGLFIVRRVMVAHGGELRITARAPRGLVASLVFPQPY